VARPVAAMQVLAQIEAAFGQARIRHIRWGSLALQYFCQQTTTR
jgi:hypothetical protein